MVPKRMPQMGHSFCCQNIPQELRVVNIQGAYESRTVRQIHTFHPFGRGQQQMVLGENVSYDVYGTFCVESESSAENNTWVREGR